MTGHLSGSTPAQAIWLLVHLRFEKPVTVLRRMAGFGATSPLPRVPATVSSQSDFQTFTLGQSLRREYRRISKKIIGRIPPEFRKNIGPALGGRRCAPGPPRPRWEPIFSGVPGAALDDRGAGKQPSPGSGPGLWSPSREFSGRNSRNCRASHGRGTDGRPGDRTKSRSRRNHDASGVPYAGPWPLPQTSWPFMLARPPLQLYTSLIAVRCQPPSERRQVATTRSPSPVRWCSFADTSRPASAHGPELFRATAALPHRQSRCLQ